MPSEPSRNAPCPCGSGAKYKNCCQGKTSWRENKLVTGAAVALVLAFAIILATLALSRAGEQRGDRVCPPGQVWSEEHQHCH